MWQKPRATTLTGSNEWFDYKTREVALFSLHVQMLARNFSVSAGHTDMLMFIGLCISMIIEE